MSASVEEKSKMAEKTKKETEVLPYEYGCEILLEKTSIDKVKDPYLPNDTYLIWYIHEGKEHIDMVRGSAVRVFDMYYDRYGANSIQKIDFGYGRMNPKVWATNNSNNKSTSGRKRKK